MTRSDFILLSLTLCMIAPVTACSGAHQEAVFAQGASGGAAQDGLNARAQLMNRDGQRIGEAILRDGPNGVVVELALTGAPPGVRAIHVHQTGRCTPDFDAASDHWNPRGRAHGILNADGPHAGDLPNLHIPQNGRLTTEFFLRDARLRDGSDPLLGGDGSALVLHEGADDHRTNPGGDSGARIACGVIEG
jgi:superoxide dismutase, Cu-Zn family